MYNVGDTVVCINNNDTSKYLTLDKKYKILSIDGSYIEVKDDYNDFYYYSSSRFKLDISCIRKYKLQKINESR